jgi:glycosyltransferase involved in cell wall biosynthesis
MNPTVVYVIQAKMGGITNLVKNLLQNRRPDEFRYEVVLTDQLRDRDTRFQDQLPADRQTVVRHRLSEENAWSVFRRVRRAVGNGPGVLIANDELELHTCHAFDMGRTVIQILHGNYDYYFHLAQKHERAIDAFIAVSDAIRQRFQRELPHRSQDVYYLPFGVPVGGVVRKPVRTNEPLRLIYTGRMWHEQKGVFDLPEIDRVLVERGIPAHWTIIGDGPDFAELQRRWPPTQRVQFLGHQPQHVVLEALPQHDVFVLPTRMEGFPVALMEAMSCGLVPIVSNIESGVPEIVDESCGFRPEISDIAGFSRAIAQLHEDRDRLETMSRSARRRIEEGFDLRERVVDYQALFARFRELKKPRPAHLRPQYGSRLDQRWIPNWLTLLARSPGKYMRKRRS